MKSTEMGIKSNFLVILILLSVNTLKEFSDETTKIRRRIGTDQIVEIDL